MYPSKQRNGLIHRTTGLSALPVLPCYFGSMLGKRLPLLSAFAVGCISTAALLIALLPRDPANLPAAVKRVVRDPEAAARSASGVASITVDKAVDGAPASHQQTGGALGEPPADPGTSVADVLQKLEAAYREALAVAAARNTPTVTASAHANAAEREPVAPPSIAATAAQPAPQVALADTASTAETGAASAPPARVALTQPAPSAPEEPRSRGDYVPDARPNLYVDNLYQGNVYQVQQLAILQYMQLLAPLSNTGQGLAARSPRETTQRLTTFPSSLTNPDNPWGFNFHPLALVK